MTHYAPEIPYKLQIKNFSTKLIPIKFHCYFCKAYKVTATKQLNFLYLVTERRKTSFIKETVENADLHQAVLSKTMATEEWCLKYRFVALLKSLTPQYLVIFLGIGVKNKNLYIL